MLGLLPTTILLFIVLKKHKESLINLLNMAEDDYEKEIYTKRISHVGFFLKIAKVVMILAIIIVFISLIAYLWLLFV